MAIRDFSDIVTAIRSELKIPATDTTTIDRIKMDINMIYMDEVVPFKRWLWLMGHTKQIHKIYYGTGTASVVPSSTAVTLSVTPASSLGSFERQFFSVDGFDEIYEVLSHTAGSANLTLTSAYQGTLGPTAAYKIWTDKVNLPADCREVVEVYHQRMRTNMEGVGYQEFRKIVSNSPKADFFPKYFNVAEYFDPSSGDDMTESDRYRLMRVYPSITQQPVTLDIDYTKEVSELVDDGDEPIMPLEDRVVLVYGARSLAWARERNEERAAYNWQLFQAKLSRMAGKIEDGFDQPKLGLNNRYLAAKRSSRLRSFGRRTGMDGFGGAASYSPPTYLENVTINGAIITDDVTVNPSVTIDGRDISVDGATMDAHIAASTAHGVAGTIVGTSDTQTLTNKTMAVGSNFITGTASRVGSFSGSGNLQADSITTSELSFLDDVTPLSTIALNDAQSTATVIAFSGTFTAALCIYSISRGTSNKEMGLLLMTHDGTTADVVVLSGDLGTVGVTFTADVSGGLYRLRYESTSTGVAPTFKYRLMPWAA